MYPWMGRCGAAPHILTLFKTNISDLISHCVPPATLQNIYHGFLQKNLYMGFRANLIFRKFKVALNPMYRIFLNFAKSCVLSCLSNVDNIKKFHRAVYEL